MEFWEFAGDVEVGEPVERFERAVTVIGQVETVQFLECLPTGPEPRVGGEELIETGLVAPTSVFPVSPCGRTRNGRLRSVKAPIV